MIFAVDPGVKGGIVYGEPRHPDKVIAMPHPSDESEWLEIFRLLDHYNSPGTMAIIERTDPFYSASIEPHELIATAKLQWAQGAWFVATMKMRTFRPLPVTWRKSVFGGATAHRGNWKPNELAMAAKEFPSLNWGQQKGYRGKPPKGDHWIYGQAAACCIWLYGEKLLLRGE